MFVRQTISFPIQQKRQRLKFIIYEDVASFVVHTNISVQIWKTTMAVLHFSLLTEKKTDSKKIETFLNEDAGLQSGAGGQPVSVSQF